MLAFLSGMLHRLWGSDAPTVPPSLPPVKPWPLIADRTSQLGGFEDQNNFFTGLASILSSILQEHDILEALPNNTKAVYVNSKLLPLILNKHSSCDSDTKCI
jgi:hypothetical protein